MKKVCILMIVQLFISQASAQKSTFDENDEGWTLTHNGIGPVWNTTGGNPGGYCTGTDGEAGSYYYWSAPSKFLGDRSTLFQDTLAFDLKVNCTDYINNWDIELAGDGISIYYNTDYNPTAAWTHYAVCLDSIGWEWDASPSGIEVTRNMFKNILGDLTGLFIRGEYCSTACVSGIDNVILGLANTDIAEDQKAELSLSVYPNPFKHDLNISWHNPENGPVSIFIENIFGQTVLMNKDLCDQAQNVKTLELNHLDSGVYFITLVSSSHRLVKKIVKY